LFDGDVPEGSDETARRHRSETTALYDIVRDNLETPYGAIDDEALPVRIPKHARTELAASRARGRSSARCHMPLPNTRLWRSS